MTVKTTPSCMVTRVFHFTPQLCLQLLPLVLCCVYVKFFEFIALNLGKRQHFEVDNGIYNGQNLRKPKILILGTLTYSYEPIFHQHIEEDHTNTFLPKGKKSLDRSPLQELEVGPRSGPYLLITIKSAFISHI